MEKTFRSLINKYFPLEAKIKLQEIIETPWLDNNEKDPYIKEVMDDYDIPFTPLGHGTNRYGFQLEGHAFKLALDKMGAVDNRREFKYGPIEFPRVVKVQECMENGLLAVTEYVTIFSYDDYLDHQSEMRDILEYLGGKYLIGDMGISSKNYVNWGIRTDGSICILDFAYIYEMSYKLFQCTNCKSESILQYDADYNLLICPSCKHRYNFKDIRRRITREDEEREIGDILTQGYVLDSINESTKELKPEFSPYIIKKDKKKKKVKKEKENKIIKITDIEKKDQVLNLIELEKELRKI